MIAFKAGGGTDTQARMIAEELEARHGWKVIPENVTGKGGANMARALKGQAADGTVLGMVVTETFGYNMVVAGDKAGYAQSDFTPLVTTAGFQMGVVSLTSKGWNTWSDVVDAAKGGQEIRFGSMSPKLADLAYLLGEASGIDLNIVSVKGGKGVMNGVNAGDLDVGWMAGIQTKHVVAGDMVNLASGLSSKLNVSPNAPTLAELGVPYNADGYWVFMAPAGLPDDARDAIFRQRHEWQTSCHFAVPLGCIRVFAPSKCYPAASKASAGASKGTPETGADWGKDVWNLEGNRRARCSRMHSPGPP